MRVCIGNYGYLNAGELRDQWITLPMEPESIKPWLVENGLHDAGHEETYISDYDGHPFPGCKEIFNEYTDIQELNVLAQVIEDKPDASDRLYDAIEADDECNVPHDVLGLINWIYQVDEVPYYEYEVPQGWEMSSREEKYGLMMAQEEEWYAVLEKFGVEHYFDLEQYALNDVAAGAVSLGEDGYIANDQNWPDERWYSWSDVAQDMPWEVPWAEKADQHDER